MGQALIELARQITKLQQENERLKEQVAKPIKKKNLTKKERARIWANRQYQMIWDREVNRVEVKERLEAIKSESPHFVLINDCKI